MLIDIQCVCGVDLGGPRAKAAPYLNANAVSKEFFPMYWCILIQMNVFLFGIRS